VVRVTSGGIVGNGVAAPGAGAGGGGAEGNGETEGDATGTAPGEAEASGGPGCSSGVGAIDGTGLGDNGGGDGACSAASDGAAPERTAANAVNAKAAMTNKRFMNDSRRSWWALL